MEGPIEVKVGFECVAEEEGWILVDKAAPLIVHPTNTRGEPTLIGGVEALLSFEIANGARLSIINRLDRETSGLVLLAKDKLTARLFGRAMEGRQVAKEYDLLCHGWPEWDEVVVDKAILRKGEVTYSAIWVKQMVHPGGRDCMTRFRVVERRIVKGRPICRLRAFPETGRTHQIRVHAAQLGFPIVGDKIYGADETCYLRFIESGWDEGLRLELMMSRHALHAAHMAVEIEGELRLWSIAMAEDMRAFFAAE